MHHNLEASFVQFFISYIWKMWLDSDLWFSVCTCTRNDQNTFVVKKTMQSGITSS